MVRCSRCKRAKPDTELKANQRLCLECYRIINVRKESWYKPHRNRAKREEIIKLAGQECAACLRFIPKRAEWGLIPKDNYSKVSYTEECATIVDKFWVVCPVCKLTYLEEEMSWDCRPTIRRRIFRNELRAEQ